MQACQYHGTILARFLDPRFEHGSIITLTNDVDLKNLGKQLIIPPADLKTIEDYNCFNKRNVYLIYNRSFDSLNDFFLAKISATAQKIQVIIAELSCPFTLGNRCYTSRFYVISAPKKAFHANDINVSTVAVDIYKEPEFKGFKKFEKIDSIDSTIEEAFLNLDPTIQDNAKKTRITSLSEQEISQLTWFKPLTSVQKKLILDLRQEMIFLSERTKLTLEQIQKLEKDCFNRYSNLCNRLKLPLINHT